MRVLWVAGFVSVFMTGCDGSSSSPPLDSQSSAATVGTSSDPTYPLVFQMTEEMAYESEQSRIQSDALDEVCAGLAIDASLTAYRAENGTGCVRDSVQLLVEVAP